MKLANTLKEIGKYFLLFLFISSCVKEKVDLGKVSDDARFSPNFSGPVFNANFTLNDLLDRIDTSAFVSTDENGLIILAYQDSITTVQAGDIVEIPRQDFEEIILSSDVDFPPWLNQPVDLNRKDTFEVNYNNNELLDSVKFKNGLLSIDVTSTFQRSGSMTVKFPSLINQTDTFSITFGFDGTVPYSNSTSGNIADYVLSIDNSVSGVSRIPVEFEFHLDNGGSINAGDEARISMSIDNIEFSSLFGYVGMYELLNTSESIDLDFFKQVSDYNISFRDPQFKVTVNNSFGMPAEVDFTTLTAYSERNGSTLPFNLTDNPYRIIAPVISNIGESVDSVITIDNTNSDLVTILENAPTRLDYGVSITSNPDGQTGHYNFVTDSSQIGMLLDVLLPLDLRAGNFVVLDTMDFDFSDMNDDLEDIQKMEIFMEVTNGLPVDARVQMYFTTSNYLVVRDSLFVDGHIVRSAEVDANGDVTSPTVTNSEAIIKNETVDKIDKLDDVKFAIIKISLQTPDYQTQYVKFYSHYNFNLKVSTDISGEISTK